MVMDGLSWKYNDCELSEKSDEYGALHKSHFTLYPYT